MMVVNQSVVRDLAAVDELSDILAESLEPEVMLPAALHHVLETVGRWGGAIIIQSPTDVEPVHVVEHNAPAEWEAQLDDPQSPLRRLAQRALASGEMPPGDPALDLAAILLIPVYEACAGVMLVSGPACSPDEVAWLTYLCRFVGRALYLHRAYASNRNHRQDLAALNKIATALTSTLQLDEILTSTVNGIRQILNVEAGSLVLLDEERGELIFKKSLSGEPDWIFQYSQKVDQGLVGECIRSGQPQLSNNTPTDLRFDPVLDGVTGFDTRSVLCAPLIARGQALGAIEVVNKRDGPFTLHDQELLVSMTASVANAIYNARLFHQFTVANADLEASRWEIIRSRNTLRALFDGITAPIYIVDRDYQLVAVNLAGARVAGSEPRDLPGRRCYDVLYRRSDPCPGCRVGETLFGGQSTRRTERRGESAHHDGTPTEWEISTYPIRDENGQPAQAIVFEQDVTEKRRLEASLVQSEKLAAVGQLAAGVAHEINNPLAAIIANTQLLQRELPPDDTRQESVDLIARAGDRAVRVVRSLLDFARQDQYELAPTDVNDTLRSAFALVEHQLHVNSVTLASDLAPDLPLIQASRDHLQGVWINLLLNARDALAGRRGEIRVATSRQGDEIHVAVADTGQGIPPERLTRIFEPFYTTKDPGRGTGLGLSLCHRVVKQHGGQIHVDSRVGQGSVFTVILPASASAPL